MRKDNRDPVELDNRDPAVMGLTCLLAAAAWALVIALIAGAIALVKWMIG